MMIKFFARGTGSAAAAADYLASGPASKTSPPNRSRTKIRTRNRKRTLRHSAAIAEDSRIRVNRRTPGRRDLLVPSAGVNEHRRRPYAGSA